MDPNALAALMSQMPQRPGMPAPGPGLPPALGALAGANPGAAGQPGGGQGAMASNMLMPIMFMLAGAGISEFADAFSKLVKGSQSMQPEQPPQMPQMPSPPSPMSAGGGGGGGGGNPLAMLAQRGM